MAFTLIEDVSLHRDGTDLLISWTDGSGTATDVYQVYVDGVRTWSGKGRRAFLAYPSSVVRIEVGRVDQGEQNVDYSGSLPAIDGGGRRVKLTWLGGTYLDASGLDDVVGFRVYMGTTAGGAVSYAAHVAEIPAYTSAEPTDGFGLGGFGEGGFGRSDSAYEWTSGPLSPGTWNFAIKAYDVAGNEGSAATSSQAVDGPPRAPAANPTTGLRLSYTYNAGTGVPTLTWTASP